MELVILFNASAEDEFDGGLRLSYLLAESVRGRGLASEMVEGLVRWRSSRPAIRSIAGGVSVGNAASARVLGKNGFNLLGPHAFAVSSSTSSACAGEDLALILR